MKLKVSAVLAFVLCVLFFAGISGCKAVTGNPGKEAPRMSLDELKARLGDASVAVIDVRTSNDWEGSPVKIKGAIREDSKNLSSWASRYGKDKTIVLYCT
jgi:predicted sulfurtransferase